MSDDKPRIRWSATEKYGIGIDNPERTRKTKDGKTVFMPTTLTIKSSFKVTEEDLLNDDPIFPFTTRPSDVAAEITEIEDERILATALEEPDCPPIADDLPRVVATVQTAAAVLSAVGRSDG